MAMMTSADSDRGRAQRDAGVAEAGSCMQSSSLHDMRFDVRCREHGHVLSPVCRMATSPSFGRSRTDHLTIRLRHHVSIHTCPRGFAQHELRTTRSSISQTHSSSEAWPSAFASTGRCSRLACRGQCRTTAWSTSSSTRTERASPTPSCHRARSLRLPPRAGCRSLWLADHSMA